MAIARSSRRARVLIAALCAALLPLMFAPGTAAVAAPARTWHVHAGEQSANGAITGMQFLPGDIWIDVGDTVHWTADSMEPHTVSFLAPDQLPGEFNPGDPTMTAQTPQPTIGTPGEFRNSGILSPLQFAELPPTITSYDLTFTGPGDYTYYCFLHGAAMKGVVHVASQGTAYPHTQRFYDAQFRVGRAAVIADGRALMHDTLAQSSSHHVFVGALDEMAMVMRYMRPKVEIRVGETIDFDNSANRGAPVPHTVTFGPEPPAPFPVGDPTNFTGGALSSGVIPTGGPDAHFRVTFKKAGVYHYLCQFHDGMGMVGTVVVRARDH
ncbi:MAG: plastocyanin/azurin family copper-binding protein [Dermatophilaceae bacterium]